MKIGVCSEKGRVRKLNEDFYKVLKIDNQKQLLVIADGMGGHKAGDVASEIAVKKTVEYIEERIKHTYLKDVKINSEKIIKNSIEYSNQEIIKESIDNKNYSGMGTTITIGLIIDNYLYAGHVGDSRIYLIRNTDIIQLSKDHSLVAEMVRKGEITESEAENHPFKNIVTRALGSNENVKIDLIKKELHSNDIILLCTDGLSNLVSNEEIVEIINKNKNEDFTELAFKLTDIANSNGGYDNITVILAKYDKDV